MNSASGSDFRATLAHHDARIDNLSSRMTGVESSIKGLGDAMVDQFGQLKSKLDRADARPSFDIHKTVSTVLALAVLFSMVVGGILWVGSSQLAPIAAKVERHDAALERLTNASAWTATTQPVGRR